MLSPVRHEQHEFSRTMLHNARQTPDPGDVPLTYNAQAQDAAVRSWLIGRIATIRASQRELAEVEPQIQALSTWQSHLFEWRRTLIDRLQAITWPNDPARYGLELSVQRIDRGLDFANEMLPERLPLDDLMASAGYVPKDGFARAAGESWHGTLPRVEHTLKELTERRDDALTRLERVVAEVDARRDLKSVAG